MAEESKEEIEKKSVSEKWAIGITIFGGVIFFIALVWYLSSTYFEVFAKLDPDLAAKAGDFLGGIVGSLWALAGVLLVYSALQAQRKDFRTNLKALENQIDEYKKQKGVLEEQSQTLKNQRFENGFYQLINHFSGIINSLEFQGERVNMKASGQVALSLVYREIERTLVNIENTYSSEHRSFLIDDTYPLSKMPKEREQAIKWLDDVLKSIFNTHEQNLSPVIFTFFHIILFIDESVQSNSKFYYKTLLNSLTPQALLVIVFYSLHNYKVGAKAMSCLVCNGVINNETTESLKGFLFLREIIEAHFDCLLSYKEK
jgi:type II secretory pathway pseudopilin PulG